MSIVRITCSMPRFALSVLICGALIYSPRPAFAQATDSSGEQAQAGFLGCILGLSTALVIASILGVQSLALPFFLSDI